MSQLVDGSALRPREGSKGGLTGHGVQCTVPVLPTRMSDSRCEENRDGNEPDIRTACGMP
jgi:hypothetical protein